MSTVLDHPTTSQVREAPNNLEAEQAILGAILANNEALNHVVTELRPEHFYAGVHQRIFAFIVEFTCEGKIANPVTLKKHFSGKQNVEDQYLARLVATATSFTNIHHYSQEIMEMAMRRMLLAAAEKILHAVHDGKSSADVSGMMAAAVSEVSDSTTAKKMRDSRATSMAIVERFSQPTRRIPTGLERLDKALGGGFVPGEVYAIAARPKYGKTMIAITISHHLNHSGVKHLFVCAEMGDEQIHERSIARLTGCSVDALDAMQVEATGHAMKDPRNTIYQSDSFLTFDSLKKYVMNAIAKHQITGFIVDYFQLVRGMQKGGNLVVHLEEVAQWIAAVCKKHNLWALVLSQTNKEGTARWGDAMEMAFTNLFYLHRVNEAGEDDKTSPLAWLQMEACRHTKYMNVGSPEKPSLRIHENGTHFEPNHIAEDGAPIFSVLQHS